MDQELFKDHSDYWQVANNIRDIYMSEGSITTLLDFERVLDEVDLYAFKNWSIGELVAGPEIGKYRVTCTFMWPENLMPDPKGLADCCLLIAKLSTRKKKSRSRSKSTTHQIIVAAP